MSAISWGGLFSEVIPTPGGYFSGPTNNLWFLSTINKFTVTTSTSMPTLLMRKSGYGGVVCGVDTKPYAMCFKAMSTCTQLQKAEWSENCSKSNAVDAQGRFVVNVQKARSGFMSESKHFPSMCLGCTVVLLAPLQACLTAFCMRLDRKCLSFNRLIQQSPTHRSSERMRFWWQGVTNMQTEPASGGKAWR